jgi:AGZA family xanthine/uracil permease-like MFS transporter
MRYHWARWGDVNAFFGLMLDNAAVIVLLMTLIASDDPVPAKAGAADVRFTPAFVATHMVPGTALGVLIGDLVYTIMAFRLARRTGRSDVTAMPLGLDTPSVFGVSFLVLIPALNHGFGKLQLDHPHAMEFAWHVGLVVLALVGIFKIAVAPMGNLVRRLIPRAGLLGSLAAVALALIAFLPLVQEVAAVPLVGLAALTIILWTLVAHRPLPGNVPGALAAVALGAGIYWLGWSLGMMPAPKPAGGLQLWEPQTLGSLYGSTSAWWESVFLYALGKLPVILPFALATIVGGIDCTESAAAAGDEYDTRSVLMTEGVASLAAGLLGGVIQTTPYIGHPAYKKMDGRAAYTLATALFMGVVGCCGAFGLLFAALPGAAMFPILVFVGLEITAQSFHATPVRHYPAVVLAAMPALAALVLIAIKTVIGSGAPPGARPDVLVFIQTLRCLSGGFIITSMLWAAALAMMIDGRLVRAAAFFGTCGICAFYGVIHSPLADEQINLPDTVIQQIDTPFQSAARFQGPYHWAVAYGLAALLLLALAARRHQASPAQGPPGGKKDEPFIMPTDLTEVIRTTDRQGPAG